MKKSAKESSDFLSSSASSLPLDMRSLQKLHDWYKKKHRKLPFRKTSDFYSVWVSETMLQQTRVAAMLPLYERFMERFPDPLSLAKSTEEEVLAYWKGLGYYSRARNLHKGMQRIFRDYQGRFPADYTEALKIEGVGPYTASAVLSICFQKRIPVLDGNVRRVLSRLFFLPNASEKDLQKLSQKLLELRPRIDPGLHNQAMMELGATICLPGTPKCEACPLFCSCASYQKGGVELAKSLPPKRAQKKMDVSLQIFLFCSKNHCLLTKEKSAYFFKNLWFFPYRLLSKNGKLIFASSCLSYVDWSAWREWDDSTEMSLADMSLLKKTGPSFAWNNPQGFRHQITHHRIQGVVKIFQFAGKAALNSEPGDMPKSLFFTPSFSDRNSIKDLKFREKKTNPTAKQKLQQNDFACQWSEVQELRSLVVSSILEKMGLF